ncbi:hypothetical protein THRCLA_08468 [Thraustotheca clavata]|uniref:CHCH domain-containing protein n=1 Tax=Thraustotheca clavata TaxID=74557 RepID=A0A1V9Z5M7_9STRA|nr:hypothetical protein THRCLA_08468 [Thraustotheca clavata]
MGSHQSRITEDDQTKLMKEREAGQQQPKAQVRVSAELVKNLHDPVPLKPVATGLSKEELEKIKHEAYLRGVEDCKQRIEAEASKKNVRVIDAHQYEVEESERVQALVEDLNKKHYRFFYSAPVNDVQCSTERDACLKCYRENGTDVLVCKEVADAFFRCAENATSEFVKK